MRVVKKNGTRVAFDRSNLMAGLLKACEKRPVSSGQLEELVDRVERMCMEAFDKEVPSKWIGKLIMDELRLLDQVAYVRFASVYRQFQDVEAFREEVDRLQATGAPKRGRRQMSLLPVDEVPKLKKKKRKLRQK